MGKLYAIGNKLVTLGNAFIKAVQDFTAPCTDFLLNWATGETYLDTDTYKITDSIAGNDLLVKSPVLKGNGVNNYIDTGVVPDENTVMVSKVEFYVGLGYQVWGVYNRTRFHIGIDENLCIFVGWGDEYKIELSPRFNEEDGVTLILYNNKVWVLDFDIKISTPELIKDILDDIPYTIDIGGVWTTTETETMYLLSRNKSGAPDHYKSNIDYEHVILNYDTEIVEQFRIKGEGAGNTVTNIVDGSQHSINGTLINIHQHSEFSEPIYYEDYYVFTDNTAPTDITKNKYVRVGQQVTPPNITGYTYTETRTGSTQLQEAGSKINYPNVQSLIDADISEKLYMSGVAKDLYLNEIKALSDNVFVKDSNNEILFYDENNEPTGACLSQTETYIEQ